jgi:hypothetical protein
MKETKKYRKQEKKHIKNTSTKSSMAIPCQSQLCQAQISSIYDFTFIYSFDNYNIWFHVSAVFNSWLLHQDIEIF